MATPKKKTVGATKQEMQAKAAGAGRPSDVAGDSLVGPVTPERRVLGDPLDRPGGGAATGVVPVGDVRELVA